MKCGNFLIVVLLFCVFFFLLLALPMPLQAMTTQELSTSKDSSLSNKEKNLLTWNELSTKFEATLGTQESYLQELLKNLEVLENNGKLLNLSLTRLSEQNKSLLIYSEQIGERMQSRDEELVQLYDELNKIEKSLLKTTNQRNIAYFIIILFAVLFLLYLYFVIRSKTFL